MENRKANLFVVGAMKAGTTSFTEMLGSHPEIYVSPIKEPHFFLQSLPKKIYEPSRFFNLENYFEKDFPEQLHIANVSKEAHYEKLFSLAKSEHTYLAEASTGYLHDPIAAENIYRYNPDAKIIILLRDPLKRAYSHYKMDVALGRTTKSFSTEIQEEIKDFQNGNLNNWSYLGMSLYADNVDRFLKLFGKNVLLTGLNDFQNDKDNAAQKIYKFLNISEQKLELKQKNIGKELKFQKLFYFFKKIGLKDYFSYFIPKKIKHSIFKIFSTNKTESVIMDEITLQKLNDIFLMDKSKLTK